MSVDGSCITHEDLENFYTACECNGPIPSCIKEAFCKVKTILFLSQNSQFLLDCLYKEVSFTFGIFINYGIRHCIAG